MSEVGRREPTYAECATWGVCPVCEAGHGQWCNSSVRMHMGRKVDGRFLQTGGCAHVARLKNAPQYVKLVEA